VPREYRFDCPLANGLHARPASALEEIARGFQSEITLANARNGLASGVRSVLGLIAADVRMGDPLTLTVSGPDEKAAHTAFVRFLQDRFPHCDDALPSVESPSADLQLPHGLRGSGMRWWRATPAAGGIGIGRAVELGGFDWSAVMADLPPSSPDEDRLRLERGLADLISRLMDASTRSSGPAADIARAHAAVARDPAFRGRLMEGFDGPGCTAGRAIQEAEIHFEQILRSAGSVLLRERVLDVQDVCRQLFQMVYGSAAKTVRIELTEDSVCLGDQMTPGEFLALDRRFLKGLVLRHAGATSHTLILARSFGVPALTGTVDLAGRNLAGLEVAVDAELGIIATDLDSCARRYYAMERWRIEQRQARLRRSAAGPGMTRDGHRVEVAANIASSREAAPAFAAGAEAVGLFRTEMLFAGRASPPSEEEQFEEYRRALTNADGRRVIIRTLDVGGDKPMPYMDLPAEPNPFLGFRAVRLYPRFESLIRTQLRALIRASTFGPLHLLVPMVACVEEVQWVKRVLEDEHQRCVREGLAPERLPPLGIMLEVPSLAFAIDQLAREVDFFSIGTNDLLQYFFAADRGNRELGVISDPLSPSFLRLLKKVIDDVHASGKRVGLCGEMAGNSLYLPLLVGLGPDEISMSTPAVAGIKAEMAGLSRAACRALLESVLGCPSVQAVRDQIDCFGGARTLPVVDEELMLLASGSRTKAEAIKEMVDTIYVLGRTDRPRDLESAVWSRESVYPTGMGGGVAVPHCASDLLRATTMGMLMVESPIEWGSIDGQPVRLVIFLGLRESDKATHMRIFSRLARKLVHDEFRTRLLELSDPSAALTLLREELELDNDPASWRPFATP